MVFVDLCYLIAAVMFVIGLKGMTKPRTAVRGNTIGSLAMLLAVVAGIALVNRTRTAPVSPPRQAPVPVDP